MKKILWVSNNIMSKGQFEDLKEVWDDVQIVHYKCDKYPDYKQIVEASENCDIIAVDTCYLGLFEDLTDLRKNLKYVITPKTQLLPIPTKTNEETAYHAKHMGWEVLTTFLSVPLDNSF